MTTTSIVRQLHASLTTHAPDQLITILQEAGYAAGEGLYKAFAAVNNPTDLDADLLGETLSEFLGRLSEETVSVMEVECRSRGDERCRFLSATPEVLGRVYNEMTAGRSYEDALSASR